MIRVKNKVDVFLASKEPGKSVIDVWNLNDYSPIGSEALAESSEMPQRIFEMFKNVKSEDNVENRLIGQFADIRKTFDSRGDYVLFEGNERLYPDDILSNSAQPSKKRAGSTTIIQNSLVFGQAFMPPQPSLRFSIKMPNALRDGPAFESR
jgi:hypothetical protein